MPLYSLDDIKLFKSIDLDVYAIRGAKTGVNNARTTGPLYDSGTLYPYNTIVYGQGNCIIGDSTITNVSFKAPYNDTTFSALYLFPGDTFIAGDSTLTVSSIIDSTTLAVSSSALPSTTGLVDTTCKLIDRDYLIEPDVDYNTVTRGLAEFTTDSTVVLGQDTTWLSDMTSGDVIQLNTYQKYFTINSVLDDETCFLTSKFDDPSNPTGYNTYTAKKWRLNRLGYRYVKQYFTYDSHQAKWLYDATTGAAIADSTFSPFIDGINLEFSPALSTSSPDIMDSNVALKKTFSRRTTNDMYQYPLPAVPNPEESLELYINGTLKDRFPYGAKDYVINYSQMPTYEYPPALEDRKVANVMFLQGIQNVSLNSEATASGTINFTDASGNNLSGIMPGSETILVDGTDQTANLNYVIDVNAGLAYASKFETNEPLVKYINYKANNLFDYGINVTKDGTAQILTIPGKDTDDILFDYESGRLKPMDKDNPLPGEEYTVQYYIAGDYISNEALQIITTTRWIRASQIPIKFQSVFLSKNGVYLDEGIDYRISYLTGRIVFFYDLVAGDVIVLNYNPLKYHVNGLTYEQGQNFCYVYDATAAVASVAPLAFVFPNQNVITGATLQSVYNVSKALPYNISGYSFSGNNLYLVMDSTNIAVGTDSSDNVVLAYKIPQDGLEYAPVETINFSMTQGTNYIAFIDRDVTPQFPAGTFVRMTNVDTAGDFYFQDASSIYDGHDTVVYFTGKAPSDIINPDFYVSDTDTIDFVPVPSVPNMVVSGSVEMTFPGVDIARNFRGGQLINLDTDYYRIQGSRYDGVSTFVSLGVQTIKDYTNAGILSAVTVSDVPFYFVGDTTISTARDIITTPLAPVMSLNYPGYATVSKDATAFYVTIGSDQSTYLDLYHPSMLLLETALTGLGFIVNDYAPGWGTSKISPVTDLVVTKDSSTVINAIPALRNGSGDTTNFTITGGVLTLNTPLTYGQRYFMDYLGVRPLGTSTVTFSGSYFTYLPAGSQVVASMRYDNLDQFYIQALSQRSFLDSVIIPQKNDAAIQQSGNVGQGGDLPDDEAGGPSSGGLTNNEYNRVDHSIECIIFDKIFDFFNGRFQAYGDEYYAFRGYKLCNNDGALSESDQSAGILSINRMFPWGDYTNHAPYSIACLTGQAIPYAEPGPKKPPVTATGTAKFSINDSTVICGPTFPSFWTYQLKSGDLIRPYDSTKNYTIKTIVNDQKIILTSNYDSATVTKPYIMTSDLPLYDDDGFMGAKIIGTKTDGFGLKDGDVFNAIIDGSSQSYTFQTPSLPFPYSILNSFFSPENFTPAQIVSALNANFTSLKFSYGWIFDSSSSFGYKDAFIIRSVDTSNEIILGNGSAVSKLGFLTDTTAWGNYDSTHSDPEVIQLPLEYTALSAEYSAINSLLLYPNKMDRSTYISYASTAQSMCATEVPIISKELSRLGDETNALQNLILEPSMSGTTTNLIAYGDATDFINDSTTALTYAQSIATNYEGALTPYIWAFDIRPNHQDLLATSPGDATFVLTEPPGIYDKRILDATIDSTYYGPVVTWNYVNVLDGTWTGYDPISVNQYSDPTQQFTFHRNTRVLNLFHLFDFKTYAYYVDSTSLVITQDSTPHVFSYVSYPTVSSLKTAINGSVLNTGVLAQGDSIFDPGPVGFIVVGPTPLLGNPNWVAPDFNLITPSLWVFNVDYNTIDDQYLDDRSSFDSERLTDLINRENFLVTREAQIRADMTADSYLRTAGNCPGNLYTWANNQYNRSTGSFVQLAQVEKQMASDKQALASNQVFLANNGPVIGGPAGEKQCTQNSGL